MKILKSRKSSSEINKIIKNQTQTEENKIIKKLTLLLSRKEIKKLDNERVDTLRLLLLHFEDKKDLPLKNLVKFLKG